MKMKTTSNKYTLISSLELIETYPVLHSEVEDIKTKLTVYVSELLIDLKYMGVLAELSDDDLLSRLEVYFNPEEILNISENKIIGSIKEYLYHLFDEMGGIENIKQYSTIVFAGSIELPKQKVVLELVKLPPNEMNVLIGV
jgi:hypothetical protein